MALHLRIDRGQKEATLHFSTFPVRIGRGAEAECRLEFAYVSRLHARIDLIDGRLLLQDEGSRSGTWVHDHSRRLQRGARVDLASVGNEFHVGPDLRVRVELDAETIEQQQHQQRDGAARAATVDAGMVPTTCYGDSDVDPRALDADAVELAVLEALADHRRAAEHLASVLVQASAGCASARSDSYSARSRAR